MEPGSFYSLDDKVVGSFQKSQVFESGGIMYIFLKDGKPNVFVYPQNNPPIFKKLKRAGELKVDTRYRFFPTNGRSEIIGVYKGISDDNRLNFIYNNKENYLYDIDANNPLLFDEMENLQLGGRICKKVKSKKSRRKRTKRIKTKKVKYTK